VESTNYNEPAWDASGCRYALPVVTPAGVRRPIRLLASLALFGLGVLWSAEPSYQALLAKKLGKTDELPIDARAILTLRFLPARETEFQLEIVCELDGRVKVKTTALSESLGALLSRHAGEAETTALDRELSTLKIDSKVIEIPRAKARDWFSGFWSALQDYAGDNARSELQSNRVGGVKVTLEPNIYEVSYVDMEQKLLVQCEGPRPSQFEDLRSSPTVMGRVSRLARWMLTIRAEAQVLHAAQTVGGDRRLK
jgi:hypothetical protein